MAQVAVQGVSREKKLVMRVLISRFEDVRGLVQRCNNLYDDIGDAVDTL